MASDEALFDIPDEPSRIERIIRGVKKNPTVALGYGGCLAVAAYGIYNFKNRKDGIRPSLYFIQLRVVAQTVAIGTITLGATWNMINHFVLNPKKKPEVKH
ncbi:HIG1 domain family member 1A, mitochondrial-like isoform X2 [Chelonus insularis]|nr:HIG1 domain family member 1A, mitochondrial-like isoform X2 [Chelonus insularis]XP_034946367.1 HIG1 domain family member 1A, mitochondrial-like isoform X2 [Chelonus insularis]